MDNHREKNREKRNAISCGNCLLHDKNDFRAAKVRIWIDLDNTPHVPFFVPIIRELERRGHTVVISARDAFQVCELADRKGLHYAKIGRHYGKNMLRKLFGLFWRSAQLVPFYFRHRPGLALSHGSRSQFLLANLARIPTVLAVDYEHSKTIRPARPRWMIVPEALSGEKLLVKGARRCYYRGIKEDVYAPEFEPDPSLPAELGFQPEDIIVTVRPPANEAHYYTPESDSLLIILMARIKRTPGIRAVLLPRNQMQARFLRKTYPEWFAGDKTVIPGRVMDGLDILWNSDLVVSGGGTMNREAAALGVPAYSIFRGASGSVDRMLEQDGRLNMIRNAEEVETRIRFVRRERSVTPDHRSRGALDDIIKALEEIIRKEHIRPFRRGRAGSRGLSPGI
jgi:predicted glycosyltransferase